MGRPWRILCFGVSLVLSFAVWAPRALAAQPEAGRVSAAAPLGQTGRGLLPGLFTEGSARPPQC